MIYVFSLDCTVKDDGGINYKITNIVNIDNIDNLSIHITATELENLNIVLKEKGFDINIINASEFNKGSDLVCKIFIDITFDSKKRTDKYYEYYNILLPYVRQDIINNLINSY